MAAATAGEPLSATAKAAKAAAAAADEDGQVVTPFEVFAKDGGKIDYDKIVAGFDLRRGSPAALPTTRRLFSAYRDFDEILDAYDEKGEKFYVYMSRWPSSESLHLGHLAAFMFAK